MVNLYMVKFLEQGNSDEKESIFFFWKIKDVTLSRKIASYTYNLFETLNFP